MSRELPIYEIEPALLGMLPQRRRLILQAPTGSGKSTQVPQMLLDHGLLGDRGQAIVLQPRRLATRLLAARVAQERGVRLGQEVGYTIRFENVTSPATRIRFVTEGVLLRQMLADPQLPGVACLVFDEFHERHLYGDITLARALQLQESVRPDLLIVVMSATLDTGTLEKYLTPCHVLESKGRTFPVQVEYLTRPDEHPPWELAAQEYARVAGRGDPGDALIFMPGAYEISRTLQELAQTPAARGCLCLPLHGELPVEQQDAAVARYERRKIIVATNVAETSLTIDGVRLVIDAGLARIPRFDPHRGINTLLVERISRASADQRAGRAGRTAPGVCVRLWTNHEHQGRALQELPEVKRLDLSEVVLTLKASGVDDVRAFRWLEPPEAKSLDRAELLLRDLGALDPADGRITALGRRMLAFPVHPRYARMLMAAGELGCVRQAALIAALVQGRELLLRRQGKDVDERREDRLGDAPSDFFLLMRAWQYADQHDFRMEACRQLGIHAQAARQVRPLYDQFLRIARAEGLPINEAAPDDRAVQKCILVGFSDHLARRLDSGTLRCELVHGRRGVVARESAVQRSPLLVAAEVREVEGGGRELNVLLSLCTAVEPAWLEELFPHDLTERRTVLWDAQAKRVYTDRQRVFRDLVLETKRSDDAPREEAARLLAQEVRKGNLKLPLWNEAVEEWIQRVNALAAWCPELDLPIITAEDRDHMVEQICHGAVSYKELKDREVWPVVRSWLNPRQVALVEKHCPERIELPGGRKPRVVYGGDIPPYFSTRLQDLYDVKQTPRIAMGRVTLTVHLLAPNQRPVQITQDLAGFWRDHYPRVKQELQRKYPKHEWR